MIVMITKRNIVPSGIVAIVSANGTAARGFESRQDVRFFRTLYITYGYVHCNINSPCYWVKFESNYNYWYRLAYDIGNAISVRYVTENNHKLQNTSIT
jgi:hypothetical protein